MIKQLDEMNKKEHQETVVASAAKKEKEMVSNANTEWMEAKNAESTKECQHF